MTDRELLGALYEAKRSKYVVLEREAARERREQVLREIERPWTAEDLYRFATEVQLPKFGFSLTNAPGAKPYDIDENLEPLFRKLSLYFSNDSRFEQKEYPEWENKYCLSELSLNKGICLLGEPGRGKTMILQLFSKNKRMCFDIVSAHRMVEEFADKGTSAVYAFASYKNITLNDTSYMLQRQAGILWDDVGLEQMGFNFGNKLNVVQAVILHAYQHVDRYPFWYHHMTSNLNMDEFEEKYGYQIRSRMRQMFNIIQVDGPDRRR